MTPRRRSSCSKALCRCLATRYADVVKHNTVAPSRGVAETPNFGAVQRPSKAESPLESSYGGGLVSDRRENNPDGGVHEKGGSAQMHTFVHIPRAFEEIEFPWQQGGVLDKISVTNFGIVVLAFVVLILLIDSEFAWLSDDELEIQSHCPEPGCGPVPAKSIGGSTTQRSRFRRLRYRSRTLSRLRAGSRPGREISAPRAPAGRSRKCKRCGQLHSGHVGPAKISQAP